MKHGHLYEIDLKFREYGSDSKLSGIYIIAPSPEKACTAAKKYARTNYGAHRYSIVELKHKGTIDAVVR